MIWQEFVFFIGGFALGAALLPSVFSDAKPAWSTSALTGAVLTGFAIAFVSLEQYLSALGVTANAVLWLVLLVQARMSRGAIGRVDQP